MGCMDSKQDNPDRQAPQEIDAYLEKLPEDRKAALARLRHLIRKHLPGCTERVSYGIPIFRMERDVVGISARKNGCSFHTMSPPLAAGMKDELRGFEVKGATIHFAPENPIPDALVVKILQTRLKARK